MAVICCIKNCKSTWEKNSKIKFYRFPVQNGIAMKYWIAATGRNNWFPYSSARICSMHFKDYSNTEHNERRRLKPDVIPTLHIHANILQLFKQNTNTIPMLQQNKIHNTANKYTQNNILTFKEKSINEGNINQSNTIIQNQGNLIVKDNNETISANVCVKCSKCANYDALLEESQQLKKRIEDFNNSQEERLNQQASIFRELMNNKETILKEKLKKIREKNRTLNRNIQRKRKRNIFLKTLLTYLCRQQFSRRK